MAALQMMGGRFHSVMPSNLIYPGACTIESLPAARSRQRVRLPGRQGRAWEARSNQYLPRWI